MGIRTQTSWCNSDTLLQGVGLQSQISGETVAASINRGLCFPLPAKIKRNCSNQERFFHYRLMVIPFFSAKIYLRTLGRRPWQPRPPPLNKTKNIICTVPEASLSLPDAINWARNACLQFIQPRSTAAAVCHSTVIRAENSQSEAVGKAQRRGRSRGSPPSRVPHRKAFCLAAARIAFRLPGSQGELNTE